MHATHPGLPDTVRAEYNTHLYIPLKAYQVFCDG